MRVEKDVGSDDGRVVALDLQTVSLEAHAQMRAAINTDSLDRYTETYRTTPEVMPPLDVFDLVDQGLRRILVDGHTRRQAALCAGLRILPARLHRGTLVEAVCFAARANATHGTPLTKGDLPTAVHNMRTIAPDLSVDALAQVLSCSTRTIVDIVQADEVREMAASMGIRLMDPKKPYQERPYTHFEAMGRAPREYWPAVIRGASLRRWTRAEIRLAGHNLRDRNTNEEHLVDLEAGKADPFIVLEDGRLEYHSDTLMRPLAQILEREEEQRAGDPLLGYLEVGSAIDKMYEQGVRATHAAGTVVLTDEQRRFLVYRLLRVRRVIDALDNLVTGRSSADLAEYAAGQ